MVPLSPQRHFQPVQREGRRGGRGNAHILSQDTSAFQEGGMNSFCKEVMGGLVAEVPYRSHLWILQEQKERGCMDPGLPPFHQSCGPRWRGRDKGWISQQPDEDLPAPL